MSKSTIVEANCVEDVANDELKSVSETHSTFGKFLTAFPPRTIIFIWQYWSRMKTLLFWSFRNSLKNQNLLVFHLGPVLPLSTDGS